MQSRAFNGALGGATALMLVALAPSVAHAQGACGGIIDNGTIQMGVNCEGHLNFPFNPDPLGIGFMGLRYLPTGAASTEPGCQCEGWGVADPISHVSGYANVSVDGVVNVQLLSFESTAHTARSTVQVGSTFRVVHDYHPSPVTPYLYEVTVTVTNISGANVNALYRRVMDWDVYPTPFDEFVTINVGNAQELYRTDTNGFNSANPFFFSSYQSGPVTDAGPNDHGALFDFDFGILAPNESKSFRTYYGAAGDESTALNALARVAAEAYSLGQPDVPGGPTLGIPNTFIFAFSGIGGSTALCSEVTPPPACTETDPCVSLRNGDTCPADATSVTDTTTLQVCPTGFDPTATECPPPVGELCPGTQLGIVRTHLGQFTETVTDTDMVCHDDCTTACGKRCTAVPAQHCYSTCLRRCTNGACLEWGTRCDDQGTATECHDDCFSQCSANWSSQTVTSYFTASCGYALTNEVVEVRDATGACTGTVRTSRNLSGAGTAAANVNLPLEPGLYDVCRNGQLLQQVTVGSCNNAPACSVSVADDRWIIAQGSPAVTLPVTVAANAYAGGDYTLRLVRYYNDEHTTFLPLPGCTNDQPGCSWLSIASPLNVTAGATSGTSVLALNPQPTGTQILWPGTVIRAEGPDNDHDGLPDTVCETSILVGLQCQMDSDCDDGSLCTVDSCDPTSRDADLRGCVTHPTCVSNDLCQEASCNPATGACSLVPTADGNPCTDGSACSTYDHCVSGACVSGLPLECNAPDDCHTAHCDAALGCVTPALPNGTSCSDGDACTSIDSCQNGHCQGGAVVVCPQDQCNTGVCDPASGCVTVANGTSCNDGNFCTAVDSCQNGACVGTNPSTSGAATCATGFTGSGSNGRSGAVCLATYSFAVVAGQTYTISNCDSYSGDTYVVVSGACSCANDDACGVGSSCSCTATSNGTATICASTYSSASGSWTYTVSSSACAAATPTACPAPDQCHAAGTCDVATASCVSPALPDGTSCDDGDRCTTGESCQGGSCAPGTPVVCAAIDQCHVAGSCDPTTGVCTNPPAPDGTSCSDGNACTQGDSCQAGVCVSGSTPTCAATDACHEAGVCDPSTGACTNPASPNGKACDDGDACTQSDTCQAGACVGASPVVCGATDQCHGAGVCDPSTGACTNPALADGTSCSDGDACTTVDVCVSGVCAGTTSVVCGALDQCHQAGVCDPWTGACTNPIVADGTACSDGDLCTQTDTCESGLCTGASPVTCAASDQCHVAGVCDPASGVCSNPAAADGASCDDGDRCTQTDTCQAGSCTGADPVVCAASDACHVAGVCDSATGVCSDPPAADGTLCNDGVACSHIDTCHAGVCVGSACDADGDGFDDDVDNCPNNANHDQYDRDHDGRGDVCDNCIVTANADQLDTDGDGMGNVCDPQPTVPGVRVEQSVQLDPATLPTTVTSPTGQASVTFPAGSLPGTDPLTFSMILNSYPSQFRVVTGATGGTVVMGWDMQMSNQTTFWLTPGVYATVTIYVQYTAALGAAVTSNTLAMTSNEGNGYFLLIPNCGSGQRTADGRCSTATIVYDQFGIPRRIAMSMPATHFSVYLVIDTTPPTLTLPTAISAVATSASGAVVTYSASALDSLGEALEVHCSPASGSVFGLGTTRVTCSATDAVGNTASGSFPVTVTVAWSDLLAPIATDGSSIFKLGRTVPVKFRLAGASAQVTNAVARLYIAQLTNGVAGDVNAASSTSAADSGNQFRYSATDSQYIFNLSTNGLAEGRWLLRVDLGDGVLHDNIVSFRK